MRTLLALALMSMLACSCSSSPKYSTHIESIGGDSFALHLESVTTMSEDGVKRALLTEAARATIDRGRIYLVVHEVASEGSIVNVEETNDPDPTPQTPTSSEQPVRSAVSLSRQRSGTIRFTIFRELPAGDRVYDASQLLDRLKRGEMPM